MDLDKYIGENIDDILDKIARSGIDSLTEGEKDFLDKKSKEM